MVTDIRVAKHLRYLDTGEKLDPREKIQATARRVGLTVPQVRFILDTITFYLISYDLFIHFSPLFISYSIWMIRKSLHNVIYKST